MNKGRKNLVPLSTEKAREIGKKGGESSVRARRAKKTLRELVELFGELGVNDDTRKLMKKLGIPEELMTRKMQPVVALFNKANKGDVSAFNAIRDIVGEKPVDRTQLEGSFDTRLEIGFVETGIDPVGSEEDVDI
jgi:general stress protein YciG